MVSTKPYSPPEAYAKAADISYFVYYELDEAVIVELVPRLTMIRSRRRLYIPCILRTTGQNHRDESFDVWWQSSLAARKA